MALPYFKKQIKGITVINNLYRLTTSCIQIQLEEMVKAENVPYRATSSPIAPPLIHLLWQNEGSLPMTPRADLA
jgi:hypothetical protein